jgi:hypothetical protein
MNDLEMIWKEEVIWPNLRYYSGIPPFRSPTLFEQDLDNLQLEEAKTQIRHIQ